MVKSKRNRRVYINLVQCRYEVVRTISKQRGWKIISSNDDPALINRCNIHWIDVPEITDSFRRLQGYQKVNHFPGMSNIARKSRLAKNLDVMRKKFPKEFDFSPRTWILPLEYSDFHQQFNRDGYSNRTFIIKPDAGCQGRGVYLTRNLEKVNRTDCQVAQRYILDPLLISGKKFDLRVYVLVTSCSPLRMYLFKDGLVRLCTAEYVPPNIDNLDQRFMHLTNYAINKHSADFEKNNEDVDSGSGSKRSIRWFLDWLKTTRSIESVDTMWEKIGDVCLKTLIAVQPTLSQEYMSNFAKYRVKEKNTVPPSNQSDQGKEFGSTTFSLPEKSCCFAILGIDILIDNALKPWLIEVNHLPSFKCDSPLDQDIKERLISQTFDILDISSDDKRNYEKNQHKLTKSRLYGNNTSNKHVSEDKVESKISKPIDRPLSEQKVKQCDEVDNNDNIDSAYLDLNELEKELVEFYNIHNPEKMDDIIKILEKYQKNQVELNYNLRLKYGCGIDKIDEMMMQMMPISDSCSEIEVCFPETNNSDPEAMDIESEITVSEVDSSENNNQEDLSFTKTIENQSNFSNEEELVDFTLLYPKNSPEHNNVFDEMVKAAQQHLDDVQMRFSAPLQQKRGGEMVKTSFPAIKGLKKSDLGRDCFGQLGTDRAREGSSKDRNLLATPTPAQITAAQRLTNGYSSQNASVALPAVLCRPPTKKNADVISYGMAYRERLQGKHQKPTINMSQVSFGCFD